MRLMPEEDEMSDEYSDLDLSSDSSIQQLSTTLLASKFAANTKKGAIKPVKPGESILRMPKMFKPDEPSFLDDQ